LPLLLRELVRLETESLTAPHFSAAEVACTTRVREFFIENLLVRIHFIIMMIRWTGLAPWEFERFPGSLTSTFLDVHLHS